MAISDKKLAYPYENFNSLEDYQKPVDDLKKEDFSKKQNKHPDDEERERTKENIKVFDIKSGELTKLYLKSDVILLAVLRNLLKYYLKNLTLILYIVLAYQAILGNADNKY